MMKQTEMVEMLEVFEKSGKSDMKLAIKMLTISKQLEYKHYKFLSGPFKGAQFVSNAPNTKWMNRYPNFEVIFISGKLKGFKTSSLITYDQRIEEKTTQWQKLL